MDHDHDQEIEPERPSADTSERRPRAPERLSSAVGNRAFTALLDRIAAGILPDGTVHPDVEATITSARGTGMPLDVGARERFGPMLGDSLGDVRVHADPSADSLARSVSARAFTTGSDLFFATGEYRPGSSDGDRLLAHELTHVVQQRGAPTSGPMVVSDSADALEVEADTVARQLTE